MRILNILLSRAKSNFSEKAIIFFSDIQNQLGYKVLSVTDPDSSSIKELVKLPIKLKTIKTSTWHNFFVANKLRKYLSDFKPDIVMSYDETSCIKISQITNIPILFFLSNQINKKIKCDAVLYNNHQLWKLYSSLINTKLPRRNFFFQSFKDRSVFNKRNLRDGSNPITLGTLLSNESDSDLITILKAISLINPKMESFQFLIFSNQENYGLVNLIRQYKIENIVKLETNADKIAKFYKFIDLYIIASKNVINFVEINELISLGIPIIFPSNANSNSGLLNDEFSGFGYNYGDVKELVQLFEKIINYPSYFDSIIAQANSKIITKDIKSYFYNVVEEVLLTKVH